MLLNKNIYVKMVLNFHWFHQFNFIVSFRSGNNPSNYILLYKIFIKLWMIDHGLLFNDVLSVGNVWIICTRIPICYVFMGEHLLRCLILIEKSLMGSNELILGPMYEKSDKRLMTFSKMFSKDWLRFDQTPSFDDWVKMCLAQWKPIYYF